MRREKAGLFKNGVLSKVFGREPKKSKELQVKEAIAEYTATAERVCEIADGLLMKIDLPEKEEL